jgi:hypothetical protein
MAKQRWQMDEKRKAADAKSRTGGRVKEIRF